jgi:hypothetical protein
MADGLAAISFHVTAAQSAVIADANPEWIAGHWMRRIAEHAIAATEAPRPEDLLGSLPGIAAGVSRKSPAQFKVTPELRERIRAEAGCYPMTDWCLSIFLAAARAEPEPGESLIFTQMKAAANAAWLWRMALISEGATEAV